MKSEAEVKQTLREWIVKASGGKIAPEALCDDTPIIEERIITSLQIMDLILQLEKITGEPLDVEQLKPGVFKNINTIYQNFCCSSPDQDNNGMVEKSAEQMESNCAKNKMES